MFWTPEKITEKVSVLYFMASFLKEIGNSRNLALEKSLKIGKNRWIHIKRHLAVLV